MSGKKESKPLNTDTNRRRSDDRTPRNISRDTNRDRDEDRDQDRISNRRHRSEQNERRTRWDTPGADIQRGSSNSTRRHRSPSNTTRDLRHTIPDPSTSTNPTYRQDYQTYGAHRVPQI